MSEFYRMKLGKLEIRYVEAENKPKARKLALNDLVLEKLSGGEVAELVSSGVQIIRESGTAPPEA